MRIYFKYNEFLGDLFLFKKHNNFFFNIQKEQFSLIKNEYFYYILLKHIHYKNREISAYKFYERSLGHKIRLTIKFFEFEKI